MARILVVEDVSAIAELVAINLRLAGHEVTLAGDAAQAQAEVDAVLPDLVEFGPTKDLFMSPKKKDTEDYITGRFG